jgi:hypothetical protein
MMQQLNFLHSNVDRYAMILDENWLSRNARLVSAKWIEVLTRCVLLRHDLQELLASDSRRKKHILGERKHLTILAKFTFGYFTCTHSRLAACRQQNIRTRSRVAAGRQHGSRIHARLPPIAKTRMFFLSSLTIARFFHGVWLVEKIWRSDRVLCWVIWLLLRYIPSPCRKKVMHTEYNKVQK